MPRGQVNARRTEVRWSPARGWIDVPVEPEPEVKRPTPAALRQMHGMVNAPIRKGPFDYLNDSQVPDSREHYLLADHADSSFDRVVTACGTTVNPWLFYDGPPTRCPECVAATPDAVNGKCLSCGAVETPLNYWTGATVDLSGIGESPTYPVAYGCEYCS